MGNLLEELKKKDLSEYDKNILIARIYIVLLLKYRATSNFIKMVEKVASYFLELKEFDKCKVLYSHLIYNREIFENE